VGRARRRVGVDRGRDHVAPVARQRRRGRAGADLEPPPEPAPRQRVRRPLTDTEMGRRLARATRGVDDIRALDDDSPFGRVCAPEDVARVVRFLVGPEGAYVNDQRIVVDGGTF